MNIKNLIIEVTRKCNMQCQHCLRGDAMNVNIKHEYITSLLEQVDYIDSVTFSGGEPSLNVKALEFFLSEAERLNVSINSFYIATNGLNIGTDFVIFCLKMFSYCNDKDSCCLDVSNDYFHRNEGDYNTELLNGLSFFRKKFDKDNYNYYGMTGLINEGRASSFLDDGSNLEKVNDITDEDDFEDADFYLNCKGEIINGCNWSYINQSKHVICKVSSLKEFYQTICDYELT